MNEREIKVLNIDDVLPNRFQPRIQFDEKAIDELAESIKIHGVIQPIVVRKLGNKYEIIAGERRYKASVLAGKTNIPAIITTLDDKESAEIALIENIQRQNLTPIEEAISYKKILDMGYLTQVTLGEKLGKTQSTIANKLRLLNLDEDVQEALMKNKISERHARSLLRLDNSEQIKMLNRIINERLTVRKLDEEIEKVLKNSDEIEEIESGNNMNNDFNNLNGNNFNSNMNNGFNNLSHNNILKEMGIPTEPIVENNIQENEVINEVNNVEPEQIVNELVENPPVENSISTLESLDFYLPKMDDPIIEDILESPMENVEEIHQDINPSFMDVDKIAATAENIYKEEAPVADIDKLLDTSNNPKMEEPVSPFQPVENAPMMNEEEPQTVPGGGKFFTMFAREEDTNPDFVKDIESEQVNMDFKEPEIVPTFNFEPPHVDNPVDSTPSVENNPSSSEIDPNRVFTMAQEAPKQELDQTMDFTQTFKPFSLNDDETFTKEEVQPEPVAQTSDATMFNPYAPKEPITFDDMGEIKVKLPEEEKVAQVDLKTVINTIRECAATIERFGFTIDTEEIDFADSYQVTFKIDKN